MEQELESEVEKLAYDITFLTMNGWKFAVPNLWFHPKCGEPVARKEAIELQHAWIAARFINRSLTPPPMPAMSTPPRSSYSIVQKIRENRERGKKP